MFDGSRLREALTKYKQDFPDRLTGGEGYKLIAVKIFQYSGNVKASDIWLADYERLMFCVGKDQFADSPLRACPKEDGFVRYKNAPVS